MAGKHKQKLAEASSIPYVAGFLDGEGCIGIYSHDQLFITIGQREPEVLRLIQEQFGGSLRQRGVGGLWAWTITSNQALIFLRAVLDDLIIKYDQACLGIEFQSIRSTLDQEERECYRLEMQLLK